VQCLPPSALGHRFLRQYEQGSPDTLHRPPFAVAPSRAPAPPSNPLFLRIGHPFQALDLLAPFSVCKETPLSLLVEASPTIFVTLFPFPKDLPGNLRILGQFLGFDFATSFFITFPYFDWRLGNHVYCPLFLCPFGFLSGAGPVVFFFFFF